jgi:hypothetical protein
LKGLVSIELNGISEIEPTGDLFTEVTSVFVFCSNELKPLPNAGFF